jgi:hypothetical protein
VKRTCLSNRAGIGVKALRAGLGLGALALAAAARAAVPAGFADSLFVPVAAPTDLAFTPDGRALVTSQGGTLSVFDAAGTLLGSQSLPAAQICSN